DAAGLTLNNGATLQGSGTVAAPLSGAGTVVVSAGTLDLTGAVGGGLSFLISVASPSVLKFDAAASSSSAIAISSANQTLEIGTTAGSMLGIANTAVSAGAIAINNVNQQLQIYAGGSLTINAAESISNGTIQLAGGVLTDAAGLTIGAGATLFGWGGAKVSAN